MTRTIRALLLVVLAAVGGCGEDRAAAWIERAREAHRLADRASEDGDTGRARRALRQAVTAPVPDDVTAHDARVVRQDLYYRLAQLERRRGEAEAAVEWANEGLSLGTAQDLFTANLLIARGKAREALGRDLKAAEDYHRALKINDTLLRRTLEDGAQEGH